MFVSCDVVLCLIHAKKLPIAEFLLYKKDTFSMLDFAGRN